jgi:hypothetical protein
LADWRAHPLPTSRGISSFCNDPVDFAAHERLASEIDAIVAKPDAESMGDWHSRFMAIKAKYLPAAWTFVGRCFGWNSSNGACERTQSVAGINLAPFRRGRLDQRTFSGLVATVESKGSIMPHVATWLADNLPLRSKAVLSVDEWVRVKGAKRDLMAPLYLEDGAEIETPNITESVEGAAKIASSYLGIPYDDAIRLELACLSCDDEHMRLVYASPRCVAREFAAQVLSAEGEDHALRAWIACIVAERLAQMHQEYASCSDKTQPFFEVVQDWTSGGTHRLSDPGPIDRALYFTPNAVSNEAGEETDPLAAASRRLRDAAVLIETAASFPATDNDVMRNLVD